MARNIMQKRHALTNMLTEHLDCFVCVGYDVDGESIVLENIQSEKDIDALMTFLSRTLKEMKINADMELEDVLYSEGDLEDEFGQDEEEMG